MDLVRDLTTNRAATQESAADPNLRPLRLAATADQVLQALEAFAESHSRWRITSRETTDEGCRVMRFVRTTRLFRFKDDIVVTIRSDSQESAGEILVVDVASGSRIGKADFGQNRRNIRELTSHLTRTLSDAGGTVASPPHRKSS